MDLLLTALGISRSPPSQMVLIPSLLSTVEIGHLLLPKLENTMSAYQQHDVTHTPLADSFVAPRCCIGMGMRNAILSNLCTC